MEIGKDNLFGSNCITKFKQCMCQDYLKSQSEPFKGFVKVWFEILQLNYAIIAASWFEVRWGLMTTMCEIISTNMKKNVKILCDMSFKVGRISLDISPLSDNTWQVELIFLQVSLSQDRATRTYIAGIPQCTGCKYHIVGHTWYKSQVENFFKWGEFLTVNAKSAHKRSSGTRV